MNKKEDRIKAKKEGICIYCLKNMAIKGVACDVCYDKRIVYRKKLRSTGICTTCSKNFAVENETRCAECKETKKNRDKNTKQKRIEKRLCIYCGKNPHQEDAHTCCECVLKYKSRHHFGHTDMWEELGKLFEAQKGICPYTGIKLTLGENASLDHIIAKSKNGTSDISNLQWVHPLVNIAKHDHSHDQFLALVKSVYEHCKLNQLQKPVAIPKGRPPNRIKP